MFSLFIALLSFSDFLAVKCLFSNDEPCIVRVTVIDMNSVELKYYPFMISLNKLTGSFNVLSSKMFVLKKPKDIYVKELNIITNIKEAKAMTEHISSDFKHKLNSKTCNSSQKGNNKICPCKCKNYCKCKEDYNWNPSPCICENNKYFKNIADTSVPECYKIIIVMNNLSTKNTNTIAKKKKEDKYYTNKFCESCFKKLPR